MTYEQRVASRIKEARIKVGLSQRELAQKLGVSGAYISYLEKGKRNLDVKLLGKIANLTQLHPLYFFGEAKPAGKETGKSLFLKSDEAAVITDENWKVININKRFEKLTGFKKEEVLGRQFESWYGQSKFTLGLIPPANFMYNFLTHDLPLNIETRLYTKSGPINVNVAYITYKNKRKRYVVRLIRKLTGSIKYQALKQYVKKLAIDKSRGVLIADAAGGIIDFNKEAQKLLGYKKDEIFHIHNFLLYKNPRYLIRLAKVVRDLINKKKVLGFKIGVRTKNGSIIRVITDIHLVVDKAGKRDGEIIVFEKI